MVQKKARHSLSLSDETETNHDLVYPRFPVLWAGCLYVLQNFEFSLALKGTNKVAVVVFVVRVFSIFF